MEAKTFAVPKLAFKIKDAGLFLGVLYLASFLLILPFYLHSTDRVLTGMELALIAVLSVVVAQLLLNWMYVLVIGVPLIMAAIFGVTGLLLYVFSPLMILPVSFIVDVINSLGGFFGFSLDSLSYVNEFLGRLGQGLMIIGGVLWWLVEKAKNINYKALAGYLIGLTGLGIVAGISSLSGLLIFLSIWAVVYMKVQGDENIPDLQLVFKIVATIAILVGMFKVSVVSQGMNFFDTLYYFGDSQNVFMSEGYHNFLKLYQVLLAGFMLVGVWKPGIIINKLSKKTKDKLFDTLIRGAGSIVDIRR